MGLLQGLTRGGALLALAWVSALYMALCYQAIRDTGHVAVSLRLLGAIVTVIVSWFVLGEALTPYHIAGLGAASEPTCWCCAVPSQRRHPRPHDPVRRPGRGCTLPGGFGDPPGERSVGVAYSQCITAPEAIHQQVQLTVGRSRPSWWVQP